MAEDAAIAEDQDYAALEHVDVVPEVAEQDVEDQDSDFVGLEDAVAGVQE